MCLTKRFFTQIVGSSILIIYDDTKIGAWLIDFAKTRKVPDTMALTHRQPWVPGNHEEGFLFGLDRLIEVSIIIDEKKFIRSNPDSIP